MLRVAVGVFLGIIAVLVVIKLPDLLKEGQSGRAQFIIGKLSPDELIARCGKPVSEKLSSGERRLTYQGRVGPVVAIFTKLSKDQWGFGSAELGSLRVGVWEKDGAAMILANLPCMDR